MSASRGPPPRSVAAVVLRLLASTIAGLLRGYDVHDLAAALGPELHGPGDEREQRVVTTAADAAAGVEPGAALADEDLPGVDDLPAEPLHAEPLGLGVASVAARRGALLVCHRASTSRCRSRSPAAG